MGFELSLMQYETFKDNKSAFMQRSNNAFFNFKSKVIDICLDNKALKSKLERKNISFWYDPDKINSFFEQNNLEAEYDDIKSSKVFNDYMAFCVFYVRLNKYVSDKNLNINDVNKKQMLDDNLKLLDFLINEPTFKYVLKSDYLFDLFFNNKMPYQSDVGEYIDVLVKRKEKDEKIMDKMNKFIIICLGNVSEEKRQELEKQNQIMFGELNRNLCQAEYREKIVKLAMGGVLRISQISFALAVISLFTPLSIVATLSIATPWLISSAGILLYYYALGGKKSEKKIEVLKFFINIIKKNIEGQNSQKLKKNEKPKLIGSPGNQYRLLD